MDNIATMCKNHTIYFYITFLTEGMNVKLISYCDAKSSNHFSICCNRDCATGIFYILFVQKKISLWNERPFTTMKFMKILYILAETYLVHLLIVINNEYDKFVKNISDKTYVQSYRSYSICMNACINF